jgi:uncharacterized SAM-binding protein YcdF (DUF218 family)
MLDQFVSKSVIFLVSPLGTAMGLAVIALALAWRGRPKGGARLGLLAVIWLWLWSMPAVSLWLRGTLEQQYPVRPISGIPSAEAMVVLGGGVFAPSDGNPDIDLGEGADSVWYAAKLFRAGKAPWVVLTGGRTSSHYQYSEARAMAAFIEDLGVPSDHLLLEEESQTTRENAAFTARLLNARGIRHILLLTPALHMPRSVDLFRAQGLEVEPVSAGLEYQPPLPGILGWLPDGHALGASGRAFKEVIGRAAGQ